MVWVAAPSARENGGTFPTWKSKGYRLCIWRDPGASPIEADHVITGEWRGPYYAANRCFEWVFANDPDCQWATFAGDDTMPDPNKLPEEIAEECSWHFYDLEAEKARIARHADFVRLGSEDAMKARTFGVCQPTGDDWSDRQGRIIERIAGSPWVGREYARRINQGKGFFWEDYYHMGADEEAMCVAQKLGVFWQRHDVCHMHMHWGRPQPGQRMALNPVIPKFLERANSRAEWLHYKAVFNERKRLGFPGHEPLS